MNPFNPIHVLRAELEEMKTENCKLRAEIRELRRKAWADWRPIVNAIGELSVQEAMDAIDRSL